VRATIVHVSLGCSSPISVRRIGTSTIGILVPGPLQERGAFQRGPMRRSLVLQVLGVSSNKLVTQVTEPYWKSSGVKKMGRTMRRTGLVQNVIQSSTKKKRVGRQKIIVLMGQGGQGRKNNSAGKGIYDAQNANSCEVELAVRTWKT